MNNTQTTNKPIVNASEIIGLMKSTHVRYPGDEGYDPEKKNSIQEKYNLTTQEAKLLFSLEIFKNIRVSLKKEVELPFEVNDDTEDLPKYGKRSKASLKRAARLTAHEAVETVN